MKLQPLNRSTVAFTTTNDCTARCAHCLMCCEPGAKKFLSAEQMIGAIEQARKIEDIRRVIFTGGEPLLLGEELLKTIAYCRQNEIITRVVTNAYWANTPENAEKVVYMLWDHGLVELNISYDDYHAEYVPEQNIVNVWKAVQGKHYASVVFANCVGENSKITPEYIQKLIGKEIGIIKAEDRFLDPYFDDNVTVIDGTGYCIVTNYLQRTGRADEEITGEENFKSVLTQEQLMLVRCGNLLSDAFVDYNNYLGACCGINTENNAVLNLGDLNKEPMEAIMNRAANSVILNAICQAGPYCLRGFVLDKDPTVKFKEKYTSVCEICEDVTTNPRAVEILRANINELYLVMKAYSKVVDKAMEEAKKQRAK